MSNSYPLNHGENRPKQAKSMPKSTLFLAAFIVFSILLVAGSSSITAPKALEKYSYQIVSNDPNYYFEDGIITYDGSKLIMDFSLRTNYSGYTPGESFIGFSAGESLSGIMDVYTYNDGWNDITGTVDYTSQKTVGGKTYNAIYYRSLGTLNDFANKTVRITFTATKSKIREWIESNNNLILYFGEATSIINITLGTTTFITTDNYFFGMQENAGYHTTSRSKISNNQWGSGGSSGKMWSLIIANDYKIGRTIGDGSVVREEITDLKGFLNGSLYSDLDLERHWKYLPDYLYSNDTSPNTDGVIEFELAVSYEFGAAINESGIRTPDISAGTMNVTQNWVGLYDDDGDEVLCITWDSDDKSNFTEHIHFTNPANSFRLGEINQPSEFEYNYLVTRAFFYRNESSNYWAECMNFSNRANNDISFTENRGTSYVIDRGLEYGITADSNNRIDVIISQANSNQTHIMLTLDFPIIISNISMFNSTATITRATNELNNFSIIEAGGNLTYAETATTDTEPANISTCVVSNITSATRCFVYLPFGSDIYFIAEPHGLGPLGVVVSFIAPTLSNNTYTPNNYIEVNATVSENASSCLLEWNDGSPSNDTMTVTNASTVTYCFLNQTSLTDREYSFNVYAETVNGLDDTGDRNITVDTNAPMVDFIAPTESNGTVQFHNFTFINVSVTDNNFNSATLDWNGANESLTCTGNFSCGVNKTGLVNNVYTYRVYANDQTGNLNSTGIRTITIDRLPPQPVIFVPENNSVRAGTEIPFIYSIGEVSPDSCFYTFDNSTSNITIPGCNNISVTLAFGEHNITLFVNDTVGNLNQTTHFFNNTFAVWNISLFNENDWTTEFDISLPQSTQLFLFCEGADILIFNMSEVSIVVLPICTVESIMIKVQYATDSYTRERLPPSDLNTTIRMYLVDAFNETLLQTPFVMGDSPFFASNLTIYKVSADGTERIISQGRFDIEFKHVSYLIKDNKYQLRITQGNQIREIGFFQSITAGTQTININEISLRPDITLISNNILLAAEFDEGAGTLVITYEDRLLQTNSVRILVFEGINQTPFYNMSFGNQDNITVTIAVNTSLIFNVKFIINHQQLGNSDILSVIAVGGFGGILLLIPAFMLPVIGFVFILFTSFVITPKNRFPGIIMIGAMAGIMAFVSWIVFENIAISALIIVFIVLGIIYELRRLGQT